MIDGYESKPCVECGGYHPIESKQCGKVQEMTLRDRFAMAALAAIPKLSFKVAEGVEHCDAIAIVAYQIADSMLAARKEKP